MNRRAFGMTVVGVAAAARCVCASPELEPVHTEPRFAEAENALGPTPSHSRGARRCHASQLQEIIKKQGGVDLFSLDSQHRPLPDERDLVKFCKLAEELGAGVQLRIQHPKLAYLTGRYADLGVLAVMVPLVEEVETANEAIDNFYYPPLGNRSWGGEFRLERSRRPIVSNTLSGGTATGCWDFRSKRFAARSTRETSSSRASTGSHGDPGTWRSTSRDTRTVRSRPSMRLMRM